MEVRLEDEVVAEGVDGGDGSEFTVGKAETGAEGVAERDDGGDFGGIGRGQVGPRRDSRRDAKRAGEERVARVSFGRDPTPPRGF